MIDLNTVSSLPIQFDSSTSTFIFNDPLSSPCKTPVYLTKLAPALLNRSLKYPEEVYFEYCNVCCNGDNNIFGDKLHYEILALPTGLLGIEFIKSHVYYCEEKDKYSAIVECLYGILTVIIQKNAAKDELDFETSIEEGIMINLRRGEKVSIPSGYFHTFINTRNTIVIFSRVYKSKGILDYTKLEREQGLGYFAIRKNARTEIVFNPRYKTIPKITKYTPSHEKFNVRNKKLPLYEAVKRDLNYYVEMIAQS